MTADKFDEALYALCDARPFKEFTIEYTDGRRFAVDYPLAVRDGVAVYLSQKGAPTIFRHESVNRIIAEPANSEAQ